MWLIRVLSFAYSTQLMNNVGRSLKILSILIFGGKDMKVYYYKTTDNYEVDFLRSRQRENLELFQVVWDVSDKKNMNAKCAP